MLGRIRKVADEFIRREGSAAVPAALRAAEHGVKEAAKVFPRMLDEERKKNQQKGQA